MGLAKPRRCAAWRVGLSDWQWAVGKPDLADIAPSPNPDIMSGQAMAKLSKAMRQCSGHAVY